MKKTPKKAEKIEPTSRVTLTRGSSPAAKPAPNAPQPATRSQTQAFDEAAVAFRAGDFPAAHRLYLDAAEGPGLDVAHAARLRARMCEHRMSKPAPPELKTAEDHYNFAITLINRRSLADAVQHLRSALALSPDADHIHYALALSSGLQGDIEGARQHLRRAIEIQPRNKLAARSDPDFAELVQQGPLRDLLFS